MPEWYVLTVALGVLSIASIVWQPLRFTLPLFAMSILIPLGFAVHAVCGMFGSGTRRGVLERRALTGALHVMQPLARLLGRSSNGLSASRRVIRPALVLPRSRECWLWSERWRDPSAWLAIVEESIRSTSTGVRRGGDFDPWDLEVRGGPFTRVRMLLGVEEHGSGRQLVRIRLSWRATRVGVATASLLASTLVVALAAPSWVLCAMIAFAAMLVVLSAFNESNAALTECEVALAALVTSVGEAARPAAEVRELEVHPEPVSALA
jgi:hypothetical protein